MCVCVYTRIPYTQRYINMCTHISNLHVYFVLQFLASFARIWNLNPRLSSLDISTRGLGLVQGLRHSTSLFKRPKQK